MTTFKALTVLTVFLLAVIVLMQYFEIQSLRVQVDNHEEQLETINQYKYYNYNVIDL